MATSYTLLFSRLTDQAEELISEVKRQSPYLMATESWTVKQVFCHLVYWHENYAANYEALSKHLDPPLFKLPGYIINRQAVKYLENEPVDDLIYRFRSAQGSLYKSIVNHHVASMVYKQHGRRYSTSEFVIMITRHIAAHIRQIKHAK